MRTLQRDAPTTRLLLKMAPHKHINYGNDCVIKVYNMSSYTYGVLFRGGYEPLCFTDRSINNNQTDAVISEIANYLKKVPTGQIKAHRRHLPLVLASYHVGGNFYKIPEHKMRAYQ